MSQHYRETFILNVHPSAFTTNLQATSDVLNLLCRSASFEVLTLDLHFVPRLDSKAIRCLVQLKERMVARGGDLKLLNTPLPIIHLFEHLRLATYFLGPGAYLIEDTLLDLECSSPIVLC